MLLGLGNHVGQGAASDLDDRDASSPRLGGLRRGLGAIQPYCLASWKMLPAPMWMAPAANTRDHSALVSPASCFDDLADQLSRMS